MMENAFELIVHLKVNYLNKNYNNKYKISINTKQI